MKRQPAPIRTSILVLALAGAVTGFIAVAGSDVSLAADVDEGEALIGTFHLRAGVSDRQASDALKEKAALGPTATLREESHSRPPLSESASAARAIFQAALAALSAGEREQARGLFEQVIAAGSDSAPARDARHHLADLYRTDIGALAAEEPQDGASATDAGIALPRDALQVADRETQVQHRRLALLDQQFVASAGDRVFFAPGSASLGSRARQVLVLQARWLKQHPDLLATIEGHADDAPMSAEQHDALSTARAEAVRQRLIEEGVSASRLSAEGWGRRRPIADCGEAHCAAQNRRAVTGLVTSWSTSTQPR